MVSRILDLLLRRYFWVVTLALMMLGSLVLAKSINLFLYRQLRELPTSRYQPSRLLRVTKKELVPPSPHEKTLAVLERNLMRAKREDLEAQKRAKEQESKQLDMNRVSPCSISNSLLAIVASSDPSSSIIVFLDPKSQETRIYMPKNGRNAISDALTLLEVAPTQAKFRNGDHVEICNLGEEGKSVATRDPQPAAPAPPSLPGTEASAAGGAGVKQTSESEFQVDTAEIERVQRNINEVMTQARVVPSFDTKGYRIMSIVPGSIYQKIGLQNGDVIQKINGYDIGTPDKAFEVYQKLQGSKTITVQIDRRSASKTFTYQIR